jgi:hypothetical protein
MKYYYIIIIIAIIYLTIAIKYQYRINNELTIQQINKPNYLQIEEIIDSRNPAVLTGLIESIRELHLWEPNYFKQLAGKDIITVQKSLIEQNTTEYINISLEKYIDTISTLEQENYFSWRDNTFLGKYNLDKPIKNNLLSNYFSHISSITSIPITLSPKNYRKGLVSHNTNLSIICQVYGQKTIYLFSPEQEKYLYPSTKLLKYGKTSQVDFWNPDSKLFPSFNKSKYIEIKLSPGQLFIIPPYWWYCYKSTDIDIDFSIFSDTLIHSIAHLTDYAKSILHNCGLYKNTNCLCCNNKKIEDLDVTKGSTKEHNGTK